MMERLDSIAPILQYGNQANEWSLPCEPEAIPALQNWLEQLSANIQTDDNIYPDILQQKATPAVTMVTTPTPSPQQPQQQPQQPQQPQQDALLSSEDYDLYPKLSDNNVWTSTTSTFQPQQHHTTSASESSYINTPPSYEQHYSSPSSASTYDYKNVKAQFWSPSYITSPVIPSSSSTGATSMTTSSSVQSSSAAAAPPPLPPRPQQQQQQAQIKPEVDYYTPSDAIDFDVVRKFDHVQPNLVFETTKMEADSGPVTPVLSNQSTTFDDKKELVHMMNVFSAPNTDIKYKKKEEPIVIVTKEEEEEKPAETLNKKEQVQSILSSSPTMPRRPSVSSDGSSIIYYNYSDEEDDEDEDDEFEDEQVKSPYADLVDMIQNMKVVEDEESIRKRHVLLIDTLYKKIAQASTTTT